MTAVVAITSSLMPGDVHAHDRPGLTEKCANLYTDEDAHALIEAAETVVPLGQLVRKPIVLSRLGIDIRRLCNRRFEALNLGATEEWQMSPRYDLTWWAAGPDRVPLDSDNALIHHVRVVPRQTVKAE